ncbi:hypothetical protein CC85DRAFT_108936 [Cutaneotrichosporon oleaginosum]|uniref:Uncharacterized protein n=1 Tax=Cutaneotrichosporon oleaginosum TaxID=879819 RepID=A0A0J0XKT9_9TREE|nr:uncharacterized protein CC85DRAFT_108936 [Cutaneotrichosporon oleaginosum]KLT41716.1 hypothetical protein CC85DRAFT_108936 [Cutaneotrichosporon oleaginosum]TXT08088.1 hypothetical protein COLE_05012 [Cutaneotrichosporon oleaginosum]
MALPRGASPDLRPLPHPYHLCRRRTQHARTTSHHGPCVLAGTLASPRPCARIRSNPGRPSALPRPPAKPRSRFCGGAWAGADGVPRRAWVRRTLALLFLLVPAHTLSLHRVPSAQRPVPLCGARRHRGTRTRRIRRAAPAPRARLHLANTERTPGRAVEFDRTRRARAAGRSQRNLLLAPRPASAVTATGAHVILRDVSSLC